MSQPRRFYLFNCDNIYELSVVEDLLNAAKAKLGFEFSVGKHNFTLSEISELSTKTIPEMKMDFAMLVVHAHESVLVVNNDNLELGYAKVYRALMEAAGGNVIVVIGGDDHYKDETEEEQSVISRWARRKIAHSQFKEEFMDGRKSFVFSWNKEHRVIHEKALLHYFDPNKKGQKFVFQPPQRSLEPETERGPAARVTEPGRNAADEDPEQLSSSCEPIDEMKKLKMTQRGSATETEGKPVDQTQGQSLRNPLQEEKSVTEQRHPYCGPSYLKHSLGSGKTVMLNTRLRYGRISSRPEDVVHWKLGWVVPDYIAESLFRQHSKTSDAQLVILTGVKGELLCQVNQKESSHQNPAEGHSYPDLAPGEILKLTTRMYSGMISFQEKDVEMFDPTWKVPKEIVSRLKSEYRATPSARLSIVSDSKDNLRCIVQIGTFNRAFSFINKTVGANVVL